MCAHTYFNRFKRPNGEAKFIYSEKASKFGETFPLLLSYVVPVKSKVKISQNFVAFSEYMNFGSTAIFQLGEGGGG